MPAILGGLDGIDGQRRGTLSVLAPHDVDRPSVDAFDQARTEGNVLLATTARQIWDRPSDAGSECRGIHELLMRIWQSVRGGRCFASATAPSFGAESIVIAPS